MRPRADRPMVNSAGAECRHAMTVAVIARGATDDACDGGATKPAPAAVIATAAKPANQPRPQRTPMPAMVRRQQPCGLARHLARADLPFFAGLTMASLSWAARSSNS
jgi:hypothetical protein